MLAAGLTACGASEKATCEEYICVSEATYSKCSNPIAEMTVMVTTSLAEAHYEIIVTQDDELPKYAASRLPTQTGKKFRNEHIAARRSARVEIVAQGVTYTRTFERKKNCETSA